MNVQELLLKMGIDISDVGKGLRHVEDDVKKSGKHFEFLGAKLGELKRGARELGHEFPVLGKLALAAISPIEGAIAGAALAIAFFKGKIDELNEKLDKMAEKAAEASFKDAMDAKEEAVRRAADEVEKYEEQLRKAASTEGDFQKAVENSIAALERKAAAQKELASMQNSGAQNELKDRLKAGLISEQDYVKQKGDLDKKAAQETFEAENKKQEASLAYQAQGAKHAAEENAKLKPQAEAALRASGEAAVKAAGSAVSKQAAEESLKNLPSRYELNKQVTEHNERMGGFLNKYVTGAFTRSTDSAEADTLNAQSEQLPNAEKQLKTAKERAEQDKEAADKAKANAAEITGKSVEAQKREKETADKLAEARTQHAEWLEQQTKSQKAREQQIDEATKRALATGGLSGLAGVTSEDRRQYMPTLQEMANSGHWVSRAMSGRGNASWVSDSPFAADAQQMLRLQGYAKFDSLHGNFDQRDQDILNIKNLHAKMVKEGAVEAGPQDVADDFKDWLTKNGLKVTPVMGE